MTAKNLSKMRKEYTQTELNESTIDPNPFKQFAAWFEETSAADFEEPNAMALATADAAGNPSVRMVLLKNYDDRGFVFFTNYTSQGTA
jgi:pyridoxamine 5'-phosphate oxidase